MSNAAFVLVTISQMLRALLASTAPLPQTTVIVPADNVSIAGLVSDVQMIQKGDPNYIRPVDGTNFEVPTSTVDVSSTRLFLDTPAPYSVFSQSQS